VSGINGSGRAPSAMTRELAEKNGLKGKSKIPPLSIYAITVPGAPAAFVDVVEKFGSKKVTMKDILEPAIKLADEGYPVSEISSSIWQGMRDKILEQSPNGREILLGNRAPAPGHIMRMPQLANTMRSLAKDGKKGFYEGRIAEEIVKVCQDRGGVISLKDLAAHESTFVEPISMHVEKFGLDVWECPPNGYVSLFIRTILNNVAKVLLL